MTLRTSRFTIIFGLIVALLGLIPQGLAGVEIRLLETIKFEPNSDLNFLGRGKTANVGISSSFRTFCVMEGGFFLFPVPRTREIKIYKNVSGVLKQVVTLGWEKFIRPTYCFFNKKTSILGVLDSGARKIFLYNRIGSVDFALVKVLDCPLLGYDFMLTGDEGRQLVVAGVIKDKEDKNKVHSLYCINTETNELDYLMTAEQKYNLKKGEDFNIRYHVEKIYPAIGLKAYFDIHEEHLFFAWEGELRIIKFDLRTKKIVNVFGRDRPHYRKPDGKRLAGYRQRGDMDTWRQEVKKYSYITNVLAVTGNIFVTYTTSKGSGNYRLQAYTRDGEFLDDVPIPGRVGAMCFNNKTSELYALSVSSLGTTEKPTILKYEIR